MNEKATQKKALPVITYDKGLKIHFNNQVLELIHLGPGHTDGDTLVLWQDRKLVHMGDLFFKDRFAFYRSRPRRLGHRLQRQCRGRA
ncbi:MULTISPECIES: hypothetical protein [Shewanella]|uniref:hypothetical protein n=1 Tax=Shewanella TaxID=22 RepID=UPI001F360BF1|nr:hypothetical protein [Shewanella indica]MCE9790752.1 hypothetical protein [Shewanella indica]